MTSLYQISTEFVQLAQSIEDAGGELKPDTEEKYLDLSNAMKSKPDGVVEWMLKLEDELDVINARIADLNTLKKQKQGQIDSYKNYIKKCLSILKLNRLKGTIYTISTVKPRKTVKVNDIDKLDAKYLRFKDPEPDKKALLDALKAGEVIEGAEIVEGEQGLRYKPTKR